MTIERNNNGAWVLSDFIDGYLVTQIYYYYTKRDAVAKFRSYCKGYRAGVI